MNDMFSHDMVSQPLLKTQSDNVRSLILVLSIMAFLATLALLFSLSADRLRESWQGELNRSATIQVMVDSPELRDTKIQTALSVLKTTLPEAKIDPISQSQSRALLKPWLGNLNLPEDLPLPALISVELENGSTLSSDKLLTALAEEGLIVEIDDHSRWSDKIGRSGRGLRVAAIGLMILIFIASIAVSVFATRAAISAQRDVIRVLVQVGAEDGFISKLFIRQAGIRGLKSGLIGVSLGAITALSLSLRRSEETALIPDLGLHWTDGIFMALLILGFVIICAAAAGITAYRLLHKERRHI